VTISTTTRNAGAAAGAVAAAGATAAAAKALLDRRGRSPKYELRADEPVDVGIRRIAAGRAASARAHLNGDSDADEQAAAIHEARKDLKKLRSVLRLVREPLGERLYQRENGRLREAAALLAGPRDAEVKLETLASLRERNDRIYPTGGLAGLVQVLEDERELLSGRIAEDGDGDPRTIATARIEAGLDAIGEWGLDGDGFELIAAGLKRSYSRGRKLYAATLKEPSGENVHEWRKRAKDLRYHLRLVREARPDKLGKAVDRAHELTDVLGDHHDLEVLREDAASRPGVVGEPNRARLEEMVEGRQAELVDQAASIGEGLYDEKPKRFVARVEGYWTEWR
jgi:CHAD domain-containing protein